MQVQCSKISVAYGDRDILDKVSILLSSGGEKSSTGAKVPPSRAALAGINGSGKSTLMQIIAGLKKPDSGECSKDPNCRVSYLPQSGLVFAGQTLRQEAEKAWQTMADLLVSMEELGKRLEQSSKDDKTTKALVEEHHRLAQTVEDSGYYRREETAEQVLSGLGFSRTDPDRDCGSFSGGWQMRIALAKVLLENPDIMLLDEPTNYLDIEARTWLESYLKHFSGAYLLVSHDRYFLDISVNEVYEIFQGRLRRYAGNYSAYENTREAELESLVKRYDEQQEEIAKSQALIQRFRYKASKAAMVQERIKKLEKMERIVIPESFKKIAISFPPPPHSGRTVLALKQIGKSYGDRQVLSGLDLNLDAGERLVVAGKNGAGKTTLLRIIAGADKNHQGTVSYGAGVAAGYFSQDAAEELRGGESLLAFMENSAPTAFIPKVRNMLGAFLFRGDDVYKPLNVLSGGEKSRLALLKLLLRPMNLLVLDEPTNHLDIHSKDVLLEALRGFAGTIIFVSHDRSFMEALSTKTLELRQPESDPAGPNRPTGSVESTAGPSTARLFYGGYGYYLDRLEQEATFMSIQNAEGGSRPPASAFSLRTSAEKDAPGTPHCGAQSSDTAAYDGSTLAATFPPRNAPEATGLHAAAEATNGAQEAMSPAAGKSVILIKAGQSDRPLTAGEQREQAKQRQALLRRLEREEKEILTALENLEKEKAALETELAKPEVYSNGERAKAVKAELDSITGKLEAKTAEWEAKAAFIGNQ